MFWYYVVLWLSVGINIFAAILNAKARKKYLESKKICDDCIASYDSVVKDQQELINVLMLERANWLDNELEIIDLDDDQNKNKEDGGNDHEEK